MNSKLKFTITLILTIFLSGCGINSSNIDTQLLITQTEAIGLTKTLTQTMIATAETTKNMETVEWTEEKVDIPTATEIPTLNQTQIVDREEVETEIYSILERLRQDNDCEFPCLFDFTPGYSNATEIDDYINLRKTNEFEDLELSVSISDKYPIRILFLMKTEVSISFPTVVKLSFTYDETSELVDIILLEGRYSPLPYTDGFEYKDLLKELNNTEIFLLLKDFSIKNILAKYGKPDEIFFAIHHKEIHDHQNHQISHYYPFSLVIYYENINLLVQYFGDAEESGENLIVDPTKSTFELYVFDKSKYPNLEDKKQVIGGASILHFSSMTEGMFSQHTFKEAFSISVDEFVENFSNPDNNEVLITPIDFWPVWE